MEVYPRVFVNYKQENLLKLLLIAKFAYNNGKNTSTIHISFQLNCNYHLRACYEEDVDLYSKSKSFNKMGIELQELIVVCKDNF